MYVLEHFFLTIQTNTFLPYVLYNILILSTFAPKLE